MTLGVPNKKQVAHRVDSATVSPPAARAHSRQKLLGIASFAAAGMLCGGLTPLI
jgi:hypothetical protein